LAVAAVLVVAAPARAEPPRLSLSPELSLGAGYDDNLFLDPAQSGATTAAPRADTIFDVHPALLARLSAGGHALALDADYLERVTVSNGELRDLLLRLDWSAPLWHHLRLSLAGLYEHYEATQFADNVFELGGAEAGLRLVWSQLWLEARYRIDARAYTDTSRNGQLDLEQWASALLHARLHRVLSGELGYRFLHLASDAANAQLDRHRLDVTLALRPIARLLLSAGYGVWTQSLPHGAPPLTPGNPGGPRVDWAHTVAVAVELRPVAWLDLFARYTLTISTSDASTGRYRVDQVLAGVAVAWDFVHQAAPPPPPFLPTVQARVVTFRAQARAGAAVAVLGDWNGWQPTPLRAIGGERYEVALELPPGRHAYSFSIDGVVTVPSDAMSWVDDGFGGRNAVVDVP
jgi:hypothetical protein